MIVMPGSPLAGVGAAVPTNESDEQTAASLFLRHVKVGDGGSVVVEAAGDSPVHLADYRIGYDSGSPEDAVSSQPLPALTLAKGQAVILTNDTVTAVPACGAVSVLGLQFSLAKTAGNLVLWQWHGPPTGLRSLVPVDVLRWTDAKDVGAATVTSYRGKGIANIYAWYRVLPEPHNEGQPAAVPGWYPATAQADCEVTLYTQTVHDEADGDQTQPTPVETPVPDKNAGLLPVRFSELLPDPDEDAAVTDEYVELYNPNAAAYDISGYTLQTGLSKTYSYRFPEGTALAPHSYTAFFAEDTGLVLSNSGGAATLIDEAHLKVDTTAAYSTAHDGSAWALDTATQTWAWTSTPTPGEQNVSNPLAAAVLGVGKKTTVKTAAAVLATAAPKAAAAKPAAAKTPKKAVPAPKTAAKKVKAAAPRSDPLMAAAQRQTAAIHPAILAAAVVAAVGYGMYEYRRDLANRIYQFRTHRANRRAHRG